MARFVVNLEALDDIDLTSVLRDVAEDIVDDAKRAAPERTGRLRESIRIAEVDRRHAVIVADPRNPDEDTKPEDKPYAAYVEYGTSDTPAQPFMRRAAYRYRTP